MMVQSRGLMCKNVKMTEEICDERKKSRVEDSDGYGQSHGKARDKIKEEDSFKEMAEKTQNEERGARDDNGVVSSSKRENPDRKKLDKMNKEIIQNEDFYMQGKIDRSDERAMLEAKREHYNLVQEHRQSIDATEVLEGEREHYNSFQTHRKSSENGAEMQDKTIAKDEDANKITDKEVCSNLKKLTKKKKENDKTHKTAKIKNFQVYLNTSTSVNDFNLNIKFDNIAEDEIEFDSIYDIIHERNEKGKVQIIRRGGSCLVCIQQFFSQCGGQIDSES